MTWLDKITVNAASVRAVNLERDGGDGGDYIITDRALSVLQALANALSLEQAPAAWNIVGPYGAGKSAFARYVSCLLGPGDREPALRVCQERDSNLADDFRKILDKSRGFCPVKITGCPQSLPERMLTGLSASSADFFAVCGKKSSLPETVFRAAPEKSFGAACAALEKVNRAVVASGGKGVLVIVDEMGKFLEHEANSPAAANAHMMQWLAEYTAKPPSGKKTAQTGKTALFGLMPETSGRQRLGRDLQNEWRKVQGRFQNVAYQVSPEAMLRLMSRIVVRKLDTAAEKEIRDAVSAPARAVWETKILSGLKSPDAAIDLFAACYPLHPVAAVLLPLLSQKIGQSERTMFNFYGVEEEGGFSDCLRELRQPGDLIPPHRLYDYFIVGRPMGNVDITVQRQWAEAADAVNRLGGGKPELQRVLKTVALFNLVKARGTFAANSPMLSAVFDARTAQAALGELSAKSFVNYRKYAGAYRIWEGSDFDLDAAERAEAEKIGRANVASELNNLRVVPPIVAHKHAIQTGNLRRVTPVFADAENWSKLPKKAGEPRLIIFLPRNAQDLKIFDDKIGKHFSGNDIRMVSESIGALENVLIEKRALEAVQKNNPEINGDRIASLELKARLSAAIQRESRVVRNLTAPASERVFCWKNKSYSAATHREIQSGISDVMGKVYRRAPRIVNELINRDNPSPQARAACKKLLLALHEHGDRENLGIEKYPPEKAIYLSLFQRTGLHHKGAEGWRLHAPGEAVEDSCKLAPAWNCISEFIASANKKPRSLVDLNATLQSAPYGMKKGVLPIFYIAVLLHDKDNIAVYEDDVYVPFFKGPHIERFLVKPESFQVQRVALEGERLKLMAQYAEVISGKQPNSKGKILEVARPLLQFFASLPEYARQTQMVSSEAQSFRQALRHARSPHEMLFADIPAALGFLGDQALTKKQAKSFVGKMVSVQRELQTAYEELCHRFAGMLAGALGLDKKSSPDKIRAALSVRAVKLTSHTADSAGAGDFLFHATDMRGNGEEWLTRMMTFLAGKPPQKWTDADESKAEFDLVNAFRRMVDVESLLEFKTHVNGADTSSGVMAKEIRLPAKLRETYGEIAVKINLLGEEEKLAILAELWQNYGVKEKRPSEKE